MKKFWFLLENQVVNGPMSTEEIMSLHNGGSIGIDTMIWWKGQKFWVTLQHWKANLPQIEKSVEEKLIPKNWFLEYEGQQQGPMTKPEMIDKLKTLKNPTKANLWNTSLDQWTKIFEYQEILNALGINRRQFHRCPLMGEAIITRHGEKFSSQIACVSAGGLGVVGTLPLNSGDLLTVEIKSSYLSDVIHVQALVVRKEPSSFGLQFMSLSMESRSIILDYVRQFETQKNRAQQLPDKKSA